tara:strand:+ start:3606 stop:4325 length:720 start_codon:yes stop_codon:yes gene_type:complete
MAISLKNGYFGTPPMITKGLILLLDPGNSNCFVPGEDTCVNLVTGGLVTGANGTPLGATHTPLASNFPEYNSLNGGIFDFVGGKGMNCDEDLGRRLTTTLSMWIYKNGTPTEYITDARNDGGQWYLSNYSSYNITYTNAMTYNFEDPYSASATDFIGKWMQLVVTSDAVSSKLYINGVLTIGGARTSIDEDFGKNFRIGTRYTTTGEWTGYMGPILAYDRVLSQKEISQNYRSHLNRFR